MRNYGVIGWPIKHTFSPAYFASKFVELDIQDAIYQAFELTDIETIRSFIQENNLSGINVTIPYKQEIIKYLDDIDPIAAEINAVNVVKVVEKKLIGYNTDYIAFQESLLPYVLPDVTALIFGSGGSSVAIRYALKELGIKYKTVSRDSKKGISYSSLSEDDVRTNKLLINTTPLGMHGALGKCVDIAYNAVTKEHFCYDLIYNPEETEFLKQCRSKGALVKNGLQMLELQADKTWDIWNS